MIVDGCISSIDEEREVVIQSKDVGNGMGLNKIGYVHWQGIE